MYPVMESGVNNDGATAAGAEPMCAAWHIWQVASLCPFSWE